MVTTVTYLCTEPGSISPLHVLIRVANAVGVGLEGGNYLIQEKIEKAKTVRFIMNIHNASLPNE